MLVLKQLVLGPEEATYQNSPAQLSAGWRTGVVFVVGSVRLFNECVYGDVVNEKSWRYAGSRLNGSAGYIAQQIRAKRS